MLPHVPSYPRLHRDANANENISTSPLPVKNDIRHDVDPLARRDNTRQNREKIRQTAHPSSICHPDERNSTRCLVLSRKIMPISPQISEPISPSPLPKPDTNVHSRPTIGATNRSEKARCRHAKIFSYLERTHSRKTRLPLPRDKHVQPTTTPRSTKQIREDHHGAIKSIRLTAFHGLAGKRGTLL